MLIRRLPVIHLAAVLSISALLNACTKSSRPAIDASEELPGQVELADEELLPQNIRQFKATVSVIFPDGANIGQDERILALSCEPALSIKQQQSRTDLSQLRVTFDLLLQAYADRTSCSQLLVGDSFGLFFETAIQQDFTVSADQPSELIQFEQLRLAPNDRIEAEKAMLKQEDERKRARLEEEAAYAEEIAADIASRQAEIDDLKDELQEERAKAIQAQKEAADQLLEQVKELDRKNEIIDEKNMEIDALKEQLESERSQADDSLAKSSRLTRSVDQANATIELNNDKLTQIFFKTCQPSEIFDVNRGECQPM